MHPKLSITAAILSASAIFLAGCGRKPGRALAESDELRPKNTYSFGDVISFAQGGASESYKQLGWGDTEKQFTWTNASNATLAFTIPPTERPLRLRMKLSAFINRNDAYQHVDVMVNDERVAQWQVVDQDDYIAIIPQEVANRLQLMVELRIPRAASPKVIGAGNDTRMLGVCCYELAITEGADAPENSSRPEEPRWMPYVYGRVIEMGKGKGAQPYLVSGWFPPEEKVTWTGKEPATIELQVPTSDWPLRLRMRLSGMVPPGWSEQPTEIYANGNQIADWHLSAIANYDAIIPRGVVGADHRLRIQLRATKPVSPKEAGNGGDSRVLGVSCESFVVEEALDSQGDFEKAN